MQVKEIMTTQTDYLSPQDTLQTASAEMLTRDFGFVPIRENGTWVGTVTDRDITVRGVAKGLSSDATLDQIMTRDIVTAHANDDVYNAAQIMEEKQIRRLLVLDQNDELAGVVSLGDIATKCNQTDLCGEIIHAVSERS